MTKQVTYVCDVCGATSTKPYKLHLTANIGKDNLFADVCCERCAITFSKKASVESGLSPGETTPVTVAS